MSTPTLGCYLGRIQLANAVPALRSIADELARQFPEDEATPRLVGMIAHGRRDGASRDTGDLAEQAAPVQTVGAQPLRDGVHHLPVRHGRESSHWVQMARRLA